MLRNSLFMSAIVGMAAVVLIVAGCNRSEVQESVKTSIPESVPGAAPTAKATSEEHGHAPGAHGGTIVSLGRDSYHAEAVFEQGGVLRIYMLGQDETRVQEVENQELSAFVRLASGESLPFTLKPEPQSDDAEGKTSQFIGELPEAARGQRVQVTIPSLRIGGERFRLGFGSAATPEHVGPMPEPVSDVSENELYLTPGGLYTKEDIQANGGVTGSQKFKGFRAAHNLQPQPGDKTCPITMTKANPQVSWIIGGKKYEFCCPPCVGEFLALAKKSPDAIQEPEAYVKR